MADINKIVSFNPEQKKLIKKVTNSTDFKHTDWNKQELSKELMELRSHIRKHYRGQQKAKCSYCKKDVSSRSALNCHVEHIAPKSSYEDFMFNPKNLCVACADCNEIKGENDTIIQLASSKKRSQYPRASSAFKIVHPHFDKYEGHIHITREKWYIDITPKGHFTIGICKLNQITMAYGVYEPDEAMVYFEELRRARGENNTLVANLIKSKLHALIDLD